MNVYWEVEAKHYLFLISALYDLQWSVLRPGSFTPGEIVPDTDWIGGNVGPRVCLDNVENKRSFPPAGNQTKIPLLSGTKPLHYIQYKQHISWWESNPGRLYRG